MDILYVIGNGSEWRNNELRYSLRSIAKYGRNVDRVYIVGSKPDFVSSDVRFLPCQDPYARKHKNIMYKVLKAVEKTDISSHFLISSDDHFYVKPVDFDNYPVYYRDGEIPAYFADVEKSSGNYFQSLLETRALLLKYGLPIWKANPHCNTHFRKDIYQRNRYLFEEAMEYLEFGGEINILMANLMVQNGVTLTEFRDSKLTDDIYKDRKAFYDRIRDVECFSIGNESLKWGVAKYLEEMFPDKCKYEK